MIHATATKFGQNVLLDVLQCVTEPIFLNLGLPFEKIEKHFKFCHIFFQRKSRFLPIAPKFHPLLPKKKKKKINKGLCYPFK